MNINGAQCLPLQPGDMFFFHEKLKKKTGKGKCSLLQDEAFKTAVLGKHNYRRNILVNSLERNLTVNFLSEI